MKKLNDRELRATIGRLAELVEAQGELVISRSGQPITCVLRIERRRKPPGHADLRQRMAQLQSSSAELIRAERDAR